MPAKPISLIDRQALIALRRESNTYSQAKPGRVPPADSRTRPNLARLWLVAYEHSCKRRVRTFTHHGFKFGIVYAGESLCVMDWEWRMLLVKPPTSMTALHAIVGTKQVQHP